jgi:hypothetical protein
MRNKILMLVLVLAALIFSVQCSKDEIGGGAETNTTTTLNVIDTVQTRTNIVLNTVWFDTSGTTSNYLIASPKLNDKVYHAYNYELIDSVIRVRVGSGQANIFYTNIDKQLVSNYNIFIFYKDNTVDTLLNHLAAVKGPRFKFIPSQDTDLFDKPFTKKRREVQTKSNKKSYLEMLGIVETIYRWDILVDNKFNTWRHVDNEWKKPTRPFDYEYTLDNKF